MASLCDWNQWNRRKSHLQNPGHGIYCQQEPTSGQDDGRQNAKYFHFKASLIGNAARFFISKFRIFQKLHENRKDVN